MCLSLWEAKDMRDKEMKSKQKEGKKKKGGAMRRRNWMDCV